MSTLFLEKNPFFVLEVTPTDKRTTIINKAEEKAFFLEGNTCDETQASLLNPSKRLSAEMDWFCGCDETTILNIRQCIKSKSAISTDELTGLARLNAMLSNFAISSFDDYFEIGYAILDIDEQFGAVIPFELTRTLNECHTKAGISTISEDEVERELNKKREQIRNFVSDKTKDLSEEDYIEFITMLAERCIADDDYEDGVIIADVVDQYELKMQVAIETATDEICTQIERIKRIANKEGIESNLASLICRLKKWDKLVQPLQLKSMASGATHQVSEHVGCNVRDLCLWLHNKQEMTETALSLVNTAKDVFAEIGFLSDVFGEDAIALNKIIDEDKEVNTIVPEIKAIERIIEKWKTPSITTSPYPPASNVITKNVVDDLIVKIKVTDSKIKEMNTAEGTITQLRIWLCLSARDGVIYIHNERHKTDLALSMAKELFAEFGDVGELHGKLSEDIAALNQQFILQNTSRPTYQSTRSYQSSRFSSLRSSKKGCLIPIIIVVVFILIGLIIGVLSDGDSSSSGNNTPSYNQPTEKKFSSSVTAGTDVYADIVSIFPAFGIYTEGSSYYTHFVCECETSIGSTAWVYMSTSEYKKHFDADASTSVSSSTTEEITFSYSKRIHGEAREADTVMFDLSSDIGASMLIDFDSVD